MKQVTVTVTARPLPDPRSYQLYTLFEIVADGRIIRSQITRPCLKDVEDCLAERQMVRVNPVLWPEGRSELAAGGTGGEHPKGFPVLKYDGVGELVEVWEPSARMARVREGQRWTDAAITPKEKTDEAKA